MVGDRGTAAKAIGGARYGSRTGSAHPYRATLFSHVVAPADEGTRPAGVGACCDVPAPCNRPLCSPPFRNGVWSVDESRGCRRDALHSAPTVCVGPRLETSSVDSCGCEPDSQAPHDQAQGATGSGGDRRFGRTSIGGVDQHPQGTELHGLPLGVQALGGSNPPRVLTEAGQRGPGTEALRTLARRGVANAVGVSPSVERDLRRNTRSVVAAGSVGEWPPRLIEDIRKQPDVRHRIGGLGIVGAARDHGPTTCRPRNGFSGRCLSLSPVLDTRSAGTSGQTSPLRCAATSRSHWRD
jgi:hypothetical protein